MDLIDNAYADDACFFVSQKSPIVAIEKLMLTATIVHRVYTSYGLGVNFKAGKSEAVFQLRGVGENAILQVLVNDNNSRLPFHAPSMEIPADYGGPFLNLVRAYKHMGTSSVGLMCNNYEAKVRASILHEELRKSRARIYHNKLLERSTKLAFAQSLLYSRLLYNCCVWRQMTSKPFARLRNAYMSPLRSICGMLNRSDSAIRFTNMQVLVDSECISISDQLRLARLRYLKRFLHKARPALVRMSLAEIDDKSSWFGLVIEDLYWLHQHVRVLDIPNPKSEPAQALLYVKFSTSWNVAIAKARRAMLELVTVQAATPTVSADECSCEMCPAVFPTVTQLYSHMCKAHEYRNPIRPKIVTTHCVSCMRCLHTRTRVFMHVAYRSKSCKQYYLANVDDAPKDVYEPLYNNERKHPASFKALVKPSIAVYQS